MNTKEEIVQLAQNSFQAKGEQIILGAVKYKEDVLSDALVKAPLKTFNRHGLIAGATGTGKTKTLQILAEQLSRQGVPSLMMDIKGDLSGISQPGNPHPKIDERHNFIGTEWIPQGFPVEFLSISGEKGVKLRATISEFGPVLLSRILELNETQSGVISMIFKFCDDYSLPLLDIKDLRKVCQHLTTDEGKKVVTENYGLVSTASLGAIMRKLLEIEQQGADVFFGEPSFEVEDLLRTDEQGLGYCHILRLMDIQSKPALFSAFMLCLMAEIYQKFPEEGDPDKPKLCVFIDEAHLIFKEASKALLSEITTIVKLIRSKGVGIYFITQDPDDVPEEILGQLGMKLQHALRAFTEKDRKSIKTIAQNFPPSKYYETSELLTSLGIGEALVTVLNEKGIPSPLFHTYLRAPQSRMDVITESELESIVRKSDLAPVYNRDIDRESAYEILSQKIESAAQEEPKNETKKTTSRRVEKSTLEKFAGSSVGRTIVREVTRSILGVLGIKSGSRSKKSWF